MNCEEALAALEAAADAPREAGMGEAGQEDSLAAHLGGCASCARDQRRMVAYRALVDGLQYPGPGPQLQQRLRTDVLTEKLAGSSAGPPRAARPTRWQVPRGLAAASLLFALALVGLRIDARRDSQSLGSKSSTQAAHDVKMSTKSARPDPGPVLPTLEAHARAHQLYLQGRTDASIAAFEQLLTRAPREPGVSDNALFFIGEMHWVRKKNAGRARVAFDRLLAEFPDSTLASAALARVAEISGESRHWVALTRRFPASSQARKAALKLARRAIAQDQPGQAQRWWRWLLHNATGTPEWEIARKALTEKR